jgi:hypothetical protein
MVARIVLGVGCCRRHICFGVPALCDRNPPSAARRAGPRGTLDRQPHQRRRRVPVRRSRLAGSDRSVSDRSASWSRPAILGLRNAAPRRHGDAVRDSTAYIAKGIEVALIVLLAVDFARHDGNPLNVVRRELAAFSALVSRRGTAAAGA